MSQIRITPDQMEARAKEYKTEGKNVNDVITKMDSLLNALKDEWEGAASDAYDARYQELRPGFEKAEQLIYDIATALETVAKNYRDADEQMASSLRG